MATPAFKLSRFRPLFLGLGASACGALCLATPACGGDGDSPSKDTPAEGQAGTSAASGAPNQGGSATAAAGTLSPSSGSGGVASGGVASGGVASGGPALEGTATRPQLAADQADDYTVLKYLDKAGPVATPVADGWDPTAGIGELAALTPKYQVAASGGSHTTVQAAIDAAVADAGTERVVIEVAEDTYREVVCVPSTAPPITLYGTGADPAATVIVFDNYSGKPKEAQAPANPCNPALGSTTYGTSGSPTFAAYAKGFQAKNLTFENDTDETGLTKDMQGVALSAQGDQQIYENVRMLGNQDTFFVKSPAPDAITRVYVTGSFIQGDTDFIFGRAVLVIDSSEIHFISSRQGSKGYAIVPSTDSRNPYGILVVKSQFTADEATTAGSIHLGRAWDESGKDVATYTGLVASGVYPNGQALVRESTLGAHIRAADPWAEAATTKRPFSSVPKGALPANRLYELGNTGPGTAAK